jgi:hypothetical protein
MLHYGGEVLAGVWWENLRERDHLDDLGLDERIILKWIFKKCMGWIDLTEDRDRW